MKDVAKGKISQSYAAELARQVGELEAENERLRNNIKKWSDYSLKLEAKIERLNKRELLWKKRKVV